MAKSIRSKRMRKLRNIKRIRHGEKELARLKNMLEKAAADEEAMKKVAEETEQLLAANRMEVDEATATIKTTEAAATPQPKQKYPCWLSHFKIKKLAKRDRRQKKKLVNKAKKEAKLTPKQRKKAKRI